MTGSIWLDGTELTGLSGKQLRAVRGRQIAMVSQDPPPRCTRSCRSAPS